jgi:hypothetical protein
MADDIRAKTVRCMDNCDAALAACLKTAGSDMEKAVCNTAYRDCLVGCGGDSKASRDCLDDCAKAYDACYAKAGSDAEKAACSTAYRNCILSCPA